ncbi:hypothetical protein EVAR_74885_1 [Eumeta japonica]|uniref:Uncharacterized protein n=1 Tax=Eumeta variegata TaxID=151549 RepID=A0A4C1Z394_EUMVA|nr:hypothetical protein EVAR_74885_1 [Eumeta japonica]
MVGIENMTDSELAEKSIFGSAFVSMIARSLIIEDGEVILAVPNSHWAGVEDIQVSQFELKRMWKGRPTSDICIRYKMNFSQKKKLTAENCLEN